MYLEKTYPLTFAQIDNRGIHRPSALFEMMQEIAAEHADRLHMSREELGILWVLSRLRVKLRRPLRVHEQVRVRTWCAGVKGPSWLRVFELYAGEELLGEAMSTWATLDPVQRRIVRPGQLGDLEALLKQTAPTALEPPGKLQAADCRLHHVHTVRYSDLDINGHMNNVKIVDIICDGLDLDQRDGLFVDEIQVNFTGECMPGEEIVLSAEARTDGMIYVRGQVEGRTRFEAAAHLAAYEA